MTIRRYLAVTGATMVLSFALVWAGPNSQQIMREAAAMSPAWMLWRPNLAWAVAFGCAATLGLMSIGGTGEFLYFQF